MVEYSKLNVKLTDAQLKKLKTTAKIKTGTTLRMSLKILDENELPHELLLTTRQKTKLGNAFNNNMLTDLKLSKAQISLIIQSVGILGSLLSELAGPLTKVAIPLAKNVLAPLGITAAASYYFSCNCCCCSCRNSKCWIYYCIFFSKWNNKKIIKNNIKQKEKV